VVGEKPLPKNRGLSVFNPSKAFTTVVVEPISATKASIIISIPLNS
jgi:hypothetical protein